jgi:predicted metal-binding membrane protein
LSAGRDKDATALESLLRRDRWVIGIGLALICVIGWLFLIGGAATGMSAVAMSSWEFPPPVHALTAGAAWDLSYWIVILLMWWIMMIAMMVPSAAPMILLYAKVYRHNAHRERQPSPVAPTAAFAGGYLMAWFAFSALATVLHWALESSGLVHRMTMWSTTTALSGAFLLAAGIYQFSPLKELCLRQCRSPAAFLSTHWRASRWGAARMGIEHGVYCVGCCWSLMLLLFVGGVMNLVWIAGLAIIVLLEKVTLPGRWIARAAGALMVLAGTYLLL